jgi:hypothetical protein
MNRNLALALIVAALFISAALCLDRSSADTIAPSIGEGTFTPFGQVAEFTAPDWRGDLSFGRYVAISGDTVVVGVPGALIGTNGNQGALYVFVRQGSDWIFQQKLTASDGVGGDELGFSVAIEGNTLIGGAPFAQIGSNGEEGAAYVFSRAGSVWTQQAKLTASDGRPGWRLGFSTALSGDVAVINTFAANAPGPAYVFVRNGGTWSERQELTVPNARNDEWFQKVALDGDRLFLGTTGHRIGSRTPGAVFFYSRIGDNWQLSQRLSAPDGENEDRFGSAIAVNGDTVLIGAPGVDVCPTFDVGAVYSFMWNGSSWSQTQRLTAPSGSGDEGFASSVALSGEVALISAYWHFTAQYQRRGSVYVLTRTGSLWSVNQELISSDGVYLDNFGDGLSFDQDTAVIGSPNHIIDGQLFVGQAYIFVQGAQVLPSPTPTPTPTPTVVPTPSPSPTPTVFEPIMVNTGTSPPDLTYSVDGSTYHTSQMFYWYPGSMHTIGTTSPQNGPSGTRYAWTKWTDCGALNHQLIAYGNTYTAYFDTQFQLTTIVSPTGSGSITVNHPSIDSFYAWETELEVTAISKPGYVFRAWIGTGDGSYSGVANPAPIVTNGPITETALFAEPRTQFDYDGDGRADVSVFRPAEANWYLLRSRDGFAAVNFGLPTDKIVPADFDGDGKTDIAVYRPGNPGVWYWLNSTDGSFHAYAIGAGEFFLTPADYDGDGKADLSGFEPTSGNWFHLNSSNGQLVIAHFGTGGDKPTVGDYDGDGKADLAVWRSSNGTWYRLNSSNGQFVAVRFGLSTDLTTPADFDGDGKTDIAVYRPSSGTWYWLNSSNGAFNATQFGLSEDIPTAADFDGDGKADISVFRPSSGIWYRLNSSNGAFVAVQFGANGDRPTPAGFRY